MWNGFCGDLIRRTNRRLLLSLLVVFAGVLIFFGCNVAYFRGFFTGPHAVTAGELISARSASAFTNSIVTLHGGTTSNERLAEYTRDDAHPEGYVSARYLATEVGGKLLLVRVDPSTPLAQDAVDATQTEPAHDFTGQAHAFSDKTAALVEHANQMGGNYLPYYVDAYNYKTFGWISTVICTLLVLAAAFGGLKYIQRNANPAEHPFAKSLARFGALESIVPQLDAEMLAAHTSLAYRGNTAEVTASWYIAIIPFGAKASPLPSLVWAYRKIVKRRIYIIIPAGTEQSLITLDRFGQTAAVRLKPTQLDELIALLKNVAPQTIYGYDKRLKKLWNAGKNNPDRISFITEARTLIGDQPLPEAQVGRKHSY